jgi:hypothetical protein
VEEAGADLVPKLLASGHWTILSGEALVIRSYSKGGFVDYPLLLPYQYVSPRQIKSNWRVLTRVLQGLLLYRLPNST